MRTLCGLIVVALLLAMPVAVFATTYELIAGNPKNEIVVVGTVEVSDDGTDLYIQFSTDAPWQLTDTHVEVVTALADVPATKGGPTPGQFAYNESSPEYQGGGLYIIQSPGDNVIIVAHGVVCVPVLEPTPLPVQVAICVSYDRDTAFLEIVVDGTSLDGTYGGYCADTDTGITVPGCYDADVFSSYDPNIPADLINMINNPGNLDLVNYMLNQDYVGKPSPSGGNYTYGDVQMAKWVLLEGGGQAPGTVIPEGDYDPTRIGEIVADAEANGDGYVPGCGDKIDILLFPYVLDALEQKVYKQPLEILIPVECDCDTAWAGTVITLDPPDVDYPFPGKNWALYVMYTMGQVAPPRMSLDSSVTTTWGSIKDR
jgi:hypothetical protein